MWIWISALWRSARRYGIAASKEDRRTTGPAIMRRKPGHALSNQINSDPCFRSEAVRLAQVVVR